MGNQLSVPQRAEDEQHGGEAGTYKVTSGHECVQNGTPVIISTHTVQHYDEVDLGISIQKGNAATSSPKTMEISTVANASGKNLGKEANPEAPAAKSRFFLTLSRPVPGRTGDQGTDSYAGAAELDESFHSAPANKGPSDSPALRAAAAPGPAADKIPVLSQAGDDALPATYVQPPLPPESEGVAPSKPKDSSFFDKFFKLDKGRGKATAEEEQEAEEPQHQDQAEEVPGLSGVSHSVPTAEDIANGEDTERQEIETLRCSVPGDPEGREVAKNTQATEIAENNTPIMSFFKTLVSPNKAETKKDPEDTKASRAESICDGHIGQKTSEAPAKGSKKKHLDSPRLGLAFRKFFRHQSAEKSPTTVANLKSDKACAPSQETQSPRGSPPGQASVTAAAGTVKEGGKDKSGPTSLPLGKLFWKKSVKGNGGITRSEEVKGKDSSNQTSNSTEKATVPKATTPPEPEPVAAAQKGKEGSAKDKKSAAEKEKKNNKQEAKEAAAPCVEQAAVETNVLHNADKPQRRPEKRRQSLGGFLKGLGPKRMSDAQVQTDPVSIGPPGKSK
ncbi:breast carcinoma-amplified sequence 1 isoform X6 [Octodon degus]|uniref:Breast carcinoma-amplified sequence 1 isoform X6 n=1 Tax=Octodon degus TaxID=10160 RepID=A0A6P6EWZ3_OCTDE|nr:breast carcinoma-amplified sequence 1 isoform X6 [Octodon degus]